MSEMQKPVLEQATSENIQEEWRTIPRRPNYEISNLGRIRRITYLKFHPDQDGYALVGMWDKNICLKRRVHILVAEAGFLGPKPSPVHEVNHRDLNGMNPRADNLEWTTRIENMRHSFREGTRLLTHIRGERHPLAKLADAQVACIRLFRGTGWRQRSVAKHFGVSQMAITSIQANKVWRHLKLSADRLPDKGETHHMAKLTTENVREIRRRIENGEQHAPLAILFGVSRPAITLIATRQTWKDV